MRSFGHDWHTAAPSFRRPRRVSVQRPRLGSAASRPRQDPPIRGVRRMGLVSAPHMNPDAQAAVGDRWIGVGASGATESRQAGVEAATAALRSADPKLLVVFASPAHDLEAMLGGIREVAPATPLIGCSTAGEIATDGPIDASVVVTALGGSGFSVSTTAARNASADLRQAGATAATCAESGPAGEHQVLLLLSDGLGGDQQEVVRGAYSVVGGSVPLVGGCAGDDLAMSKTFQFFDGEVLEDCVVAAAINSDAPLGIGVQHGWTRVGEPFLVTASSGTRVLALDDRPALDVYLERLHAPEDAGTDPAAFTRFALTHPFGLSRRSGEEVRFIAEANFEDRSIGCIAAVCSVTTASVRRWHGSRPSREEHRSPASTRTARSLAPTA